MTFKSTSYATLLFFCISLNYPLLGIELFSFSSDDDGTKAKFLTITVHDKEEEKKEVIETANLQRNAEAVEREIEETDARIKQKKQKLARKLREYQCSQK